MAENDYPSNYSDNRRIREQSGLIPSIPSYPALLFLPPSPELGSDGDAEEKIWFSNHLLPHPTQKPQDVEGKQVISFCDAKT